MSDDFFKGFKNIRLPSLPTYEIPEFTSIDLRDDSASGLIEALDKLVGQWKRQLPKDAQPTIYAILANGSIIEAHDFYEAGHNGIGILGRLVDDGAAVDDCLVLVHQASLQLVCRVLKTDGAQQRRSIGYHVSRKDSESS